MYGFCSTSKKSLLFSLPFFRPLPVSTLAASIFISKAPVVSSGDLNVRFAFHLSNLPAIVVDDFTWNFIQLCTGVISNTGACARPLGTNTTTAEKHKTAICMADSLDSVHFMGGFQF